MSGERSGGVLTATTPTQGVINHSTQTHMFPAVSHPSARVSKSSPPQPDRPRSCSRNRQQNRQRSIARSPLVTVNDPSAIPAIRRRILTLISSCLPDEITASKYFYYEANRFISWLAGISNLTVNQTAAITAALSPLSTWEGNQLDAIALCLGHEGRYTTTDTHAARAIHIAEHGDDSIPSTLGGRKVNAFYRNLLHPSSDVGIPLDRHIVRACYGHHLTLTDITRIISGDGYTRLESILATISASISLPPIVLANRLWYVMRRLSRSNGQHSLPSSTLHWRPIYPGGNYRLTLNHRGRPSLALLPGCSYRPWLLETPFTHPRYGKETYDHHNRVRVYLGRNHPYADASGCQYRYRLVMSYLLGRRLRPDEHAHHTGPTDDEHNLELLLAEHHGRFHAYATQLAGYTRDGKFVEHDALGPTFPWPRFRAILGPAARTAS